MKKNDGYKKIKSIFYIVAIISMVIAIFGKVHASEYTRDDILHYLHSYMEDIGFDNVNYFDGECLSSYDSCFCLDIGSGDIRQKVFIMCNHLNTFNMYTLNVSNNKYSSFAFYNATYARTLFSSQRYTSYSQPIFFITCFYNASTMRISAERWTTYNYRGTNSNLYAYWTNSYYYTDNTYNINIVNNLSSNTLDINGDIYCTDNALIKSGGTNINNIDNLYPRVLNDDNFIIYKSYGVGGVSDPLLNIQYADDIFSQGYTYTSSTIYNLTFDVDGTETTVAISSSVYPDDFFENGSFRTSFDLIYRMLSNKIVNFSSADTVTLTAVSMSATAYPTSNMQGTSETVTKSTLCNLVLKGSQGGEDIESDTIPAVSDVTIVYDQVSSSGDFYNHSGTWHNDVTIPDWVESYTIVIHGNYFPSGFDLDFSYDWLVDHQTFSKFQFLGYVDPTYINIQNAQVDYYDNLEFHKTDIIECIKFLGLLNSCDVVRIIVGDTDITGTTWTTAQDNIFFMSSYYQKLSIKGLGNIQSAVESGTYYTKALYWYTKDRLDNMSGYLADYTKKSLSNQTVQNGYLQSINTNIISIKDSIDSGVNSIVSAISGISSGGSSYSLPSLSTELQRLFIPSLTWESIDFDEYMDSLGVLKIPFEMTNDVLDVTKASYSSTLDLHINDFEIDVTGNNDKLTVFEDQDYSFNPRSIFNNQAWTMLTYLNAFAVILAEAWFTYCHIFRREKADDC